MARPPWDLDWVHWWGPWSRRGGGTPRPAFFRSGEVRIALLALLVEQPLHGYGLMQELEARSGSLYSASAGTVYPVLQQLVDEGLIVAERRGAKTVYSLTKAGHREVAASDERVAAIWERAGRWQQWGDDMGAVAVPLALSVSRVVGAAFQAVRDRPESSERVRGILEEATERIRALSGRNRAVAAEDE